MIEIALTFDDNFWAPAYATMRSVCLTTRHPENLRFHLLVDGVTPDHRAILDTIRRDYGAVLNVVDLAASNVLGDRIASFPTIRMRRFRPVIYARLFLGELLPPDVTKVLYLDSDTFVRSDIDALFQLDLQGKAIAAALQPDRMHCIAGKDLKARHAFSMAEPYFNSGVMLIDMSQYRGVDFAGVLQAALPRSEIEMFYYDQDIVNFAFRGRIHALDYRWNLQNPEPAHEVLNPSIVHYSANPKPWLFWSRVAFKRTYRHLMTNAYFYQYRRERLLRLVRGWFGLR